MRRKLLNESLDSHNQELLRVLKQTYGQVGSDIIKRPKSSPPRYLNYLWAASAGLSTEPEYAAKSLTLGHAIRQIHDYYGWKAKKGTRGHCSGALYRTAEFMKIPVGDRDGSASNRRNIHIEHAVPIKVLTKLMLTERRHSSKMSQLFESLMQNSICVAMTSNEEKLMRANGVSSQDNDACHSYGCRNDKKPYPLRRYGPLKKHLGKDFRIFNIATKQEVSVEFFSFADHENTLKTVSRIASCDKNSLLFSLNFFLAKDIAKV